MRTALVMAEIPAPCCFTCEYCYVPKGFDRRRDTKTVCGRDFLELGSLLNADRVVYWMCGIGEPFMRTDCAEVFSTIAKEAKIVAVSNLSYLEDNTPEKVGSAHPHNFAAYWSVHWAELQRRNLQAKVLERVKGLLDRGVRVWPTLVCHPIYYAAVDRILDAIAALGLVLIPCRWRLGQQDLAGTEWEARFRQTYSRDERLDFRLWDLTPDCWKVAGGLCTSGASQVIVDAWWNITTCHGDYNRIDFGKFPEDTHKLKLRTAGLCRSSKCPCKHSVFWGVNGKFPYSFENILKGWNSWLQRKH